MKKVNRTILTFSIIVAAIILTLFLISLKTESSKIILFYREDCPHCKNVENYLSQNNVETTIQIQKKAIENQKNAQELIKIAEKCKIPKTELGVPFLYAENKCFMGEVEIMAFFDQKLNLSNK